MPDLEPITREEKLLDGEDLTPITRKEKFIKRIYDKTQEIPEPITREEMFLKKAGEGGGGDVTIEQLNITENGTYSEEGKAFSPVIVEVPQPTMTKLTATENGTYTAPSGTAYYEVDVDVPLPSNAYLLKEVEDLPASVATFEDGADMPLKSLTATIEAVQEGSGDPYPAGGSANKWDEVMEEGYINPYTGNYENSSDNLRSKNKAVVNGLSEIYFCCAKSGTLGNFGYVFYDVNNIYISGDIKSVNTTLEVPQNAYYFAFFVPKSWYGQSYANNIAVNYPSNITTYAPYSNIRPISGFTEGNVSVSGVNLWDEEWELGYYATNGNPVSGNDNIRSKNYTSVKPDTSYYARTNNQSLYFCEYDINKNFIGRRLINNNTFTTSSSAYYIRFNMGSGYGTTYNNDISISYPSTDTDYHAYNGHTTTISWEDEVGTVYGGTLDVVSGVLTVDRASVDLGALNYTKFDVAEGTLFRTSVSGAKLTYNVNNIICSAYKYSSKEARTNGTFSIPDTTNIDFINDSYTTASDFKQAMNGVQLVYELATPTTYQLSPTAVASLLGMNNVWADTGDIQKVEYLSQEVSE